MQSRAFKWEQHNRSSSILLIWIARHLSCECATFHVDSIWWILEDRERQRGSVFGYRALKSICDYTYTRDSVRLSLNSCQVHTEHGLGFMDEPRKRLHINTMSKKVVVSMSKINLAMRIFVHCIASEKQDLPKTQSVYSSRVAIIITSFILLRKTVWKTM